jgi:hypothetical protein
MLGIKILGEHLEINITSNQSPVTNYQSASKTT